VSHYNINEIKDLIYKDIIIFVIKFKSIILIVIAIVEYIKKKKHFN